MRSPGLTIEEFQIRIFIGVNRNEASKIFVKHVTYENMTTILTERKEKSDSHDSRLLIER